MKAAVFHAANCPLVIEDLVIDNPGLREVLVRITASSLCHSDLLMMDGTLPMAAPAVLGHEAAGIVEAVGAEVVNIRPGDHVVACCSAFCGSCNECLSGHLNLCSRIPKRGEKERPRLSLNGKPVQQLGLIGGFAEKMLVHENSLAKLPKQMPFDKASILGCAVVTGVGAAINTAKVNPGSSVAVIGCGGVGLSIIQGSRLAGAERIMAIDREPAKLELAKKVGATDVLLADANTVSMVKERTGGGVHYAFEAVGLSSTMEQAAMMLRPGGALTVVGVPGFETMLSLNAAMFIFNELKLQGCRMGSSIFPVDIPRLASFYLQGRLDLDSLVSERISLNDINKGFEIMKAGKQVRSVIVFD